MGRIRGRKRIHGRNLALLAGSILGGGALVLAIDTVSRGLAPMSIAPGALSALIGGAFFLLLLRRQRIGPSP